MSYRPEIDGLRAVAVLPVMLFHAEISGFSGGFLGVDVFFVISGYLITSLLLTEMEAKRFSLLGFYERRARRILPALFVVMFVCIPFAWMWMVPSQFESFAKSLVATSLFSSNFLFWSETGYFNAAAFEKPLLHTWSLAVEEQYYLIFPLFLLLIWRFGKQRTLESLVVIAALSLALTEWSWRFRPSANFYLAPTRIWELLAGAIAAIILLQQTPRQSSVLGSLGLVLILTSFFLFDESMLLPNLYSLCPVIGTVLIILFADKTTLIGKVLSWPVLVGIGLISYSAYLWHQPLFSFVRLRTYAEPEPVLMLSLCAATLVLAYLSWRFVEQPFRGTAPLFPRRWAFATVTFICIVVLASGGLIATYEPKLRERFNPAMAGNMKILHETDVIRQAAVHSKECYYPGKENSDEAELAAFIDNWPCVLDPLNTKRPKFAVFGDSHAADRSASFRSLGYDIIQLGGPNCPLVPQERERFCGALRSAFQYAVYRDTPDYVVLANRYTPDELTPQYLQSVVDYWGESFENVLLFSPMPEFKNFDDIFVLDPQRAARIPADTAAHEAFFAALQNVEVPDNVTVINTKDLFCSRPEGCAPIGPDGLLVVDYGHLSALGYDVFGTALKQVLDEDILP